MPLLPSTQTPTLSAPATNLRWLVGVRILVILGQLGSVLYAQFVWQLALNYTALYGVLVLMVLGTLILLWCLRQGRSVSNAEFLGHLLFDMACLTAQLYMTGGATNPFVSWYLVPLAIGAVVLPVMHGLLLGGLALTAYSALLFFHQPVDVLIGQYSHPQTLNLHIVGMWFNFMLSASLISLVVTRMASALRQQQQLLALQREQTLRDEQILAVATQAAGTTHELGTPLGAVQLNLEEIAALHPEDAALQQEVSTALGQVQRCKAILRRLGRDADLRSTQDIHTLPAAEFVDQLLARWRMLQPQAARAVVEMQGNSRLHIQADSSLQQAVINLLDNAARASERAVELTLYGHRNRVSLAIRDHGPGIHLKNAEQLGKTVMDSQGMGLGLLLSHATIERFGGTIRLFNHPEGGTLAQLELPAVEAQ
ncbi:MAG: ATP-binding protein [Spongiibacteraceae bacterium]|jgi:two-component system sensor histidine kinase RegB|nr:ATP-binding protein [Spongiibacteraceae bacterium]